MLQGVFKVTTLCMDTRSQSFPPLVNGLIYDGLQQSSPSLNKPLLKNDFFDIPRYSSYSMRVRWANSQPSNVKFFFRIQCAKMIKIGSFLTELLKNKNVSVFWGHSVQQCAKITNTFLNKRVVGRINNETIEHCHAISRILCKFPGFCGNTNSSV